MPLFIKKMIPLFSIIALLLLWKTVSLIIGFDIILPSPEQTVSESLKLMLSPPFYTALGATAVRVGAGFIISLSAGVVIGLAAGYSRVVNALISPLLTAIKATPILSIILLAIIWFSTNSVPVFVCFLVIFPIICGNVLEGVKSVDHNYLNMAVVYKLSKAQTILHIYLPATLNYLMAGAKTALGIAWKAVIAAEVLCQPVFAIGTGMQDAKIQLETATLFAWTFMAILLSALSEWLFSLLEKLFPWKKEALDEH